MNKDAMTYVGEMSDIQELSVNQLVDMLMETYMTCIRRGIPVGKVQEPAFLWGATGIGKSDAIREFAAKLERETGKEVRVIDVRLSTQSPMDIKGLLLPSADRTASEYMPLKTYLFEDRDDLIYVLFYDELTSAPAAIQAAAYEIIRDRKIDQNYFPDNVIIIGAGNRVCDKGLTYRMLRPLANRFEHYQITTSFKEWEVWAKENGVHPLVLDYLRNHPDKLTKDDVHVDDLAFRSPRAWGNVSFNMNLLYEPDGTYSATLRRKIAGTIGVSEEREFYSWILHERKMPSLSEIVEGTCNSYPKDADVTNAVIRALIAHVNSKRRADQEDEFYTLSVRELDHICAYVNHFPADFTKVFYNQLIEIPGLDVKLMRVPSFHKRKRRSV